MKIEDIRTSGLLESYILGTLSERESKKVEVYLDQYPQLKSDINQVERAFRAYAEVNGIPPRQDLKAEIIRSITNKGINTPSTPKKSEFGPFFIPTIILAGLLAASLFWGNNHANEAQQLEEDYQSLESEYAHNKLLCDSISDANAELTAMLAIINNAGNKIVPMTATGNYANATLYLHTNETLRKNYIQALVLPNISTGQAFQLWSLKVDHDPIPLNVFNNNESQIFEVDFEEGTATYAITIEPAGGSQVPNLEHLIGTIGV